MTFNVIFICIFRYRSDSNSDSDYEPSDEKEDVVEPRKRPPSIVGLQLIDEFEQIIAKHQAFNTSSASEINVECLADSERRKYDKRSCCFYCGKMMAKVTNHYMLKHMKEKEVANIAKMSMNSPERKLALEKLRLKGNFINNMKVLNDRKGDILVVRRANKDAKAPESYLPCIYCLGFFC